MKTSKKKKHSTKKTKSTSIKKAVNQRKRIVKKKSVKKRNAVRSPKKKSKKTGENLFTQKSFMTKADSNEIIIMIVGLCLVALLMVSIT